MWDIIAVISGFVGTLLLAQPFNGGSNKDENHDRISDVIGCVLGICAAFFAALAVVYLR